MSGRIFISMISVRAGSSKWDACPKGACKERPVWEILKFALIKLKKPKKYENKFINIYLNL